MTLLKDKTKNSKPSTKHIDVEALNNVGQKFTLINSYIEKGEEIPKELTKNFVYITLSDDPYSELE